MRYKFTFFTSTQFLKTFDWLIDWLTDWLIDSIWVIDWVIDRLIDWLVGWLIDWLVDWLIGWLIDWLIDSFIHSFIHSFIVLSFFSNSCCFRLSSVSDWAWNRLQVFLLCAAVLLVDWPATLGEDVLANPGDVQNACSDECKRAGHYCIRVCDRELHWRQKGMKLCAAKCRDVFGECRVACNDEAARCITACNDDAECEAACNSE